MKVEWDPAKDAANRRKHDLPLSFGARVLANVVRETGQWVEGEERSVAYGLVGIRLFACVYTMRGAVHRIISVRKASRQEQRECGL